MAYQDDAGLSAGLALENVRPIRRVVRRIEQRGGGAIAFMAAALWICCDMGHVDLPNETLWNV
jgi:hypothetical protein